MKWQGNDKAKAVWVVVVLAILVAGARDVEAEIIMSEPANLGPVINDAADVQESDFSRDGLELYFSSGRPGGHGGNDIWVARRETLDSPWQDPVNLGPNVNSSASEVEPTISSDGLELYFRWWNDWNLRVCKRPSEDAPWSNPVKVGHPVGSREDDPPIGANDVYGPDISADGLCLYFASTRYGGRGSDDIWVATRETLDAPWDEPVNLGPNVNSSSGEVCPSISSDGLTLVFSRGISSLWATTRKSIEDEWGPAVNLGISGPGYFLGASLSPDGSTMYFQAASGWGGYGADDFWEVRFTPVVDFNVDGVVDTADMLIMTDNWHTHRPLCDIGPLPVGDNYVDVKDLFVLADYLEPGDPTLIAHWAFDETEGVVAEDSAGACHGTVVGTALWQPEAGQVDGALELDGNTFVGVDHALSPADGPFSVLAWVKATAAGQTILSQVDGANWLCTDPASGYLLTELKGAGRDSGTLCSDAIISDGNWHQIALVCEGEARTLYVDDVPVAEDIQAGGPVGCTGGLNIGCDKDMAPSSFFTGLIDDVRIYNRAVRP